MAFTGNWTCNTFKQGALDGTFNFGPGTTQTFYIALYTNAATLNQNTTAYTSAGESIGSGYTAGGQLLTISQVPTIDTSNNIVYWSFANAAWTGAISARGALIYLNNGTTNPAVCVLDFGSTKQSVVSFVVQFPVASSTSAILRLE
jgi:hypothetical protein